MNRLMSTLWTTLLLCLLAGCNDTRSAPDSSGNPGTSPTAQQQTGFRIVAGSENKTLQPLLDRFASEHQVGLQVDYLGSVDIMMKLQGGHVDYDAVWPANSLWLTLGDTQKHVKDEQSIYWSPVVFGVKRSVAQKLGWIGKKDVKVADILSAAENGNLRFMMTSATQSNSGASAYLGFLYAFAGRPEVLTSAHLDRPEVREKIKRILGRVDRSSGSSGWLKDLFLQKVDQYDALVNYEAVIIEANQALIAQGKEPLIVVYPSDGLAVADAPLGYVEHAAPDKAKLFQELQAYLLSAPVQQEIQKLGRRVGPIGEEQKSPDKTVFNPDWGITTAGFLNQIRYPKAEVIRQALDLYQTAFRKPSLTIYCLDFSGSMAGEREAGVKAAMQLILDPQKAKQNLLQASPGDITTVMTFSDHILKEWTVTGNDPQHLLKLWQELNGFRPGGGTDIYSPVMHALDLIKQRSDLQGYFPAVILMTDGESNTGATFDDFRSHLQQLGFGRDIPVFAIRFGEASEDQLKQITDATSGRIFEGREDIVHAFREVKGYN